MLAKNQRWWLSQDSEEILVDASPERLYEMVADLPRMGDWSPECQRVEWQGGATGPAEGAKFVGHNRGGPGGLIRWCRQGRVITAEQGREFAFVTEEGGHESTIWRFCFEPFDGRTRIVETYDVKRLPVWARIIDVPTNRHRQLQEGMRHTLEHLKRAAETARGES